MDYSCCEWEFLDVADLLDQQHLQQEATMMANTGPYPKPFGPSDDYMLRRQVPFMAGSGCGGVDIPDDYQKFLGITCRK